MQPSEFQFFARTLKRLVRHEEKQAEAQQRPISPLGMPFYASRMAEYLLDRLQALHGPDRPD